MEASKSPALFFSFVQQILSEWSVIFLVLLSMTIQVILVLGGANRYRISSHLLNFIIWSCYMAADFVATSALGAMIHYSNGDVIYAVWASMMMVHLGGPDTITAYSVPDNSLWKRHCFNVVYQGSIAAYVVYTSASYAVEKERNLLGGGCLMFMVGITKYAERAWALWLASPPQIVSSAKPIYNFMKTEHVLGLDIKNIRTGYKQEWEQIPDDEIADVDVFERRHEGKVDYDTVNYQNIVFTEIMDKMGEKENDNGTIEDFCKNFKDSNWQRSLPLRMAKTLVTKWEREEEFTWVNRWLRMFQLFGTYDKSAVHGERLTVGGELLTQLWVYWGHLGCAEESYNPTAMQTDPKQFKG